MYSYIHTCRKDLHSCIFAISHKDFPLLVEGQAVRHSKLARTMARCSPEEQRVQVKLCG